MLWKMEVLLKREKLCNVRMCSLIMCVFVFCQKEFKLYFGKNANCAMAFTYICNENESIELSQQCFNQI